MILFRLLILFVLAGVLVYKVIMLTLKNVSGESVWKGALRHVVCLLLTWHAFIGLCCVILIIDLLERDHFSFEVFLENLLTPAMLLVGGLALLSFSVTMIRRT